MPVQAMVDQKSQFAWEAVAGVPETSGFKQPLSFSLKPASKAEVQRFRPEGYRFDTIQLYNKEWSGFKLDGVMDFQEMAWIWAWALRVLVTTTPGGATNARRHLLNHLSSAPNVRKVATIERGDGTYAERISHAVMDALNLKFSRQGFEVSGGGFGALLEDSTNDAIVKTASPTSVEQQPFSGPSWQMYLANSQAGLDAASPLYLPFSFEWGLTNLAGPVFGGNGLPGFGAVVELVPQGTAKLRLPVGDESLELKANLRTGDKIFLRSENIGEEIETGQSYTHILDTAMFVSDAFGEPSDEQGGLAIDIPLVFGHDLTWGQAVRVDMKNKIATI